MNLTHKAYVYFTALLLLILGLPACTSTAPQSGTLTVAASTTIVGDVVTQVAGGHVAVTVLMPPGSDPHSYQPVPQDLAKVVESALVFTNGFRLEESLDNLLAANVPAEKLVVVSNGITPLVFGANTGEAGAQDPHVWMDPNNVMIWTDNIAAALAGLDPANAADYQANAQAYKQQLAQLNAWSKEQFASVPQARRLIVSDHDSFGYLARAYDLQVTGALTGFSSMAEASAKELAAIEDTMKTLKVPAVFVSTTVPPGLADQVAEDTGVPVVRLYIATLSQANGPAASYIAMMHDTVTKMVDAWR